MTVAEIAPGKTSIGWIGLGVMGSSMCGHLMARGFSVTVYNRTRQKAEALLGRCRLGGYTAGGGRTQRRGVLHRRFPSGCSRSDAGLGGALAGSKPGSVLVDMTTSQPSLAQRDPSSGAAAKDVFSVDAPVSGGDVGAREARLSIMIGGDAGGRGSPASLLGGDGQDDRPPGRSRRGTAHQDGQPGR